MIRNNFKLSLQAREQVWCVLMFQIFDLQQVYSDHPDADWGIFWLNQRFWKWETVILGKCFYKENKKNW